MSSERVNKTTPNPTRLEVIQTRTKGESISGSIGVRAGGDEPLNSTHQLSLQRGSDRGRRLSMRGLICKGFSANVGNSIKPATVNQVKTHVTTQLQVKLDALLVFVPEQLFSRLVIYKKKK